MLSAVGTEEGPDVLVDDFLGLPERFSVPKKRGQAHENTVKSRFFAAQGLVVNVTDHVLRAVKVVLAETVGVGRTEGPVDLQPEEAKGDVLECHLRILSQIGHPINDPWLCDIVIVPAANANFANLQKSAQITAQSMLDDYVGLRDSIIAGKERIW